MIKHQRSPTPAFFNEDIIFKLRDQESQFYREEQNERMQKRSRTLEENVSVEEELTRILLDEFHGKCAICEQDLGREDLVAITHRFRPRRSATNLDGTIDMDHYNWYTYQWENLYIACQFCNEHKSTLFPVKGIRAGSTVPISEVDTNEKRLIIDPCDDDPEVHFYYDQQGRIHSPTITGQHTIEVYQLNRPHLLTRRREIIESSELIKTKTRTKDGVKTIEFLVNKDGLDKPNEFLGLKRYLIKLRSRNEPDLLIGFNEEEKEELLNLEVFVEPTSEEAAIDAPHDPSTSEESIVQRKVEFVELLSIDIKNFKNITDLYFEFPKTHPTKGNWTFFLGENGSGKSSILQAIALCLIGQPTRNELKLDPKDFLQRGKRKCEVQLQTNEGKYEITITKDSITGTEAATSTFLLAYGSTRLMAQQGVPEQDHTKRTKPGNLFDPTAGLVNAKKWLLAIDKNSFNMMAVVLKEVLNLSREQTEKVQEGSITRKGGEIFFTEPDKFRQELHTLSDGYKILIALVCDICRSISEVLSSQQKDRKYPHQDFEEVHGIIIIDELGTHLHPRWKMRIVSALRKAFRRMRFIVSSHEPLCLRGLEDGEVMVVEYENKDVQMLENLPDPSKYRIDQILTSPFFGLYSVVDPKEGQVFYDYYRLLRKGDDLSPAEAEQLASLSQQVRNYNIMGNSLREELAYYAVDKILAEQADKQIRWDELKEHTKKAVEKLWEEYESDL